MDDAAARPSPDRARHAIGLIDLTDLSDDHSPDGIDDLCRRAREHGTAAVCVWPEFVGSCAELLAGSGVRVATVVNFPGGDQSVGEVTADTERALRAGADDIDVVLPYRAFAAGDRNAASELVEAVVALVEAPRIVKVILETGELGSVNEVAAAARLAIDAGADFVKTSTGKVPVGATPEAVDTMLAEIARADRTIGIKPSGGIRTYDDAIGYIDQAESVMGAGWATPSTFRFGASGLLDALLATIDGDATPRSSGDY